MGFEPVTVLSHWQLYERLGLYEPTYLVSRVTVTRGCLQVRLTPSNLFV